MNYFLITEPICDWWNIELIEVLMFNALLCTDAGKSGWVIYFATIAKDLGQKTLYLYGGLCHFLVNNLCDLILSWSYGFWVFFLAESNIKVYLQKFWCILEVRIVFLEGP